MGGKGRTSPESQDLARLKIGKDSTFVDLALSFSEENLLNIQGMEDASFIQAYYEIGYISS